MESIYRPNDPFASHQKELERYVRATTGDIIEFGCGYGSTPLIRKCIENTDRKLFSIESDPQWLIKMQELLPANDQCVYIYNPNTKFSLNLLKKQFQSTRFSVCFIDSTPWESRIDVMERFRDISDWVMIHDVDYYPKHGIIGKQISEFEFDFSDVCKNFTVYYPDKPWPYPTGPPLLIFSDVNKSHIDSDESEE